MILVMSCLSGLVMVKFLNNFFRLFGRLDRLVYLGFMVMNIVIFGFIFICFLISLIDMEFFN